MAGLAYSIAYNYLNRLVGERHIGDTIFFQGGTAYNDSVAAAFSMILGKEIIVPPYNGVMGAIGVALLAREKMSATEAPSRFRGWDLEQVDYTVREFVCKGCTNECDIRQFTIDDEKTYWGDKCSDRYRKRAKVDKEPVIRDLVAFRERALLLLRDRGRGLRHAAAQRQRRSPGHHRHPPGHVHLRPAALLGDVLRRAGFDVVLSRRATRRSGRWASTPPWPSPASPSASPTATCRAARGRASTTSSCPTS